MYTESIILAGMVLVLGVIISISVAVLIKGIFFGIRLRHKLQTNKGNQNWQSASVASKPS